MWWYILIGIVLAIVIFIWWRYTSVERGIRACNEKVLQILDPVGEKLFNREDVTPEEIETLAAKAFVRPMLYAVLKDFERLDLFPETYKKPESQAEAILSFWLMHPNELQDVPEEMRLVEKVNREIEGEQADFFVFRYKMREGHWAAEDGWLLGLAGPFVEKDIPYSGYPGAFSRCGDKFGELSPAKLVDWYIGMVKPNEPIAKV